jgi:hypothetical protein
VALIIFCTFFSISFSAWPKLYIDAGVGMIVDSPTSTGILISPTASLGYTFVDHFAIYYQFQMGFSQEYNKSIPSPGDYIKDETMMNSIGLEYSHYFGQFGILGGVAFGLSQKRSYGRQLSMDFEKKDEGFFGALNVGVSFIATQYIEPFIKGQYVVSILSGDSGSSLVDHDFTVYIGIRVNVFKTKHIDKNY